MATVQLANLVPAMMMSVTMWEEIWIPIEIHHLEKVFERSPVDPKDAVVNLGGWVGGGGGGYFDTHGNN